MCVSRTVHECDKRNRDEWPAYGGPLKHAREVRRPVSAVIFEETTGSRFGFEYFDAPLFPHAGPGPVGNQQPRSDIQEIMVAVKWGGVTRRQERAHPNSQYGGGEWEEVRCQKQEVGEEGVVLYLIAQMTFCSNVRV